MVETGQKRVPEEDAFDSSGLARQNFKQDTKYPDIFQTTVSGDGTVILNNCRSPSAFYCPMQVLQPNSACLSRAHKDSLLGFLQPT